jgi:predicted DNA binding CopG/RHH family protein
MKKQITIRIDEEAVAYFKVMAGEQGIPYQSLINMYLLDCAASHRKLHLKWA